MDFSVWVFVGLLLVVGVTWVVIYNASALLGVAVWAFGRIRALAPVLKTSVAQSLRNRFRTGTTIALFTLVVFVLVTGVSTSNAFIAAMNDNAAFGGGFQVQATTSPASPVTDMASALRQAPGIRPSDITAFAGQSVLPLKVRQGDSGTFETHPVRALDDAFTAKTTYGFAAMARGYTSSRQVWDAVATQPNLAARYRRAH